MLLFRGLSSLPARWYHVVSCPKAQPFASKKILATAFASLHAYSSLGTLAKAHAERCLMSRYKESGHSSITAMILVSTVGVPVAQC
jgi:hypothetical protein